MSVQADLWSMSLLGYNPHSSSDIKSSIERTDIERPGGNARGLGEE